MAKKKNLKSTVANAAAKAKAEAQKKQQTSTRVNTAAAKKSPASFAPAKKQTGMMQKTSPSKLVNQKTTVQGKKSQAANFKQNGVSYTPKKRNSVTSGNTNKNFNPFDYTFTHPSRGMTANDILRSRVSEEFGNTGKTLQQLAMERARSLTKDQVKTIEKKRDADAKAMQDRLKRQSKIEISAYDKKLPKTQQQMIREAKSEYETAKAWGDREGMKQAHAKAEEARHNAGYSGGAWGNQHIAPGLTAKDRQRMAGLDEKGRNAYLRAKYDKAKAATNNDTAGVQRFESDLDKIAGSDYYRDRGNVTDFSGHGTSRIGAARKQEQENAFKAGVKSLAYGIPGSIMSVGETGNAALEQAARERSGDTLRNYALQKDELRTKIDMVKRGEGNPEWGSLKQLEYQLQLAEWADKVGYGTNDVDQNLRGQRWMKKSQEYAQEMSNALGRPVDKKMAEGLLTIGNMAPSVALSLIPGVGPAAGMAMIGTQAAGSKMYDLNTKLEQTGDIGEFYEVSPAQSFVRGALSGGVEALTERIPLGRLKNILLGKTGKTMVREIVGQMFDEGIEEGASYAMNYALDKIANDPTAEWSGKDFVENIVMGALVGGAMAGGASGIRTGIDSLSSADPGNLGGAAELQSMRGKTPLEQSRMKFQKLEQQIRAEQQNGPMPEEKARAYAKELVSLRDTIRAQQAEVQRASEASNPLAQAAREVAAERTGQIPTERLRGQNETAVKAERVEAPTRKAVVRKEDGTTQEVVLARTANTTQAKTNRLKPENIRLRPVGENGVQSRQEPVVNRPTESLTRSAQTLGENGQKALMSVRDGRVSDADYFEGFAKVYNQALNGVESKNIKLPDALTDAQAHAAFSAGANDRAVLAEERKNAARFASVAGEDAGLVYDQYVSKQLGSSTAEAVNEVSKMLGVRTVFVDSVDGGRANAQIQGNVIQVEKFNTNPVRTIFGHEITHRVQELAPESYQAFHEYVMQDSKARDAIDEVVENYRQHGKTISQEQAANEVVADYAGDLINDRDLLEKFVRDNKSNKTLLEKFLDVLRDIAAKLKGSIHRTNVDEAVSLLEKAVQDAAGQAEAISRKAKDGSSRGIEEEKPAVMFSLKEPVEYTKDLVALHNITEEKLLKTIELGGFPMPSIAVTRRDIPHTNFGDISLVMSRATVDPKADRRNKVFGGDIWSATFPDIEYKASEEVLDKLQQKYEEIKKTDSSAAEGLYRFAHRDPDILKYTDGEKGLIEKLREDGRIMRTFLVDTGKTVPIVYEETDTQTEEQEMQSKVMLSDAIEAVDAYAKLPKNTEQETRSARSEWVKKYGDQIREAQYKAKVQAGESEMAAREQVNKWSGFKLLALARRAVEYRNANAQTKKYEDRLATDAAIWETVGTMQKEYEAWLQDTFGGIEETSGIRNEKSYLTEKGNRRSWKATHDAVTLDNIVRAMKRQNEGNEKNTSGFMGLTSLRIGMYERFKDIASMHKAEHKLQSLSDEELNKIEGELEKRLRNIVNEIMSKRKKSLWDLDIMVKTDIEKALTDVANGGKYTTDAIIKGMESAGQRVTNEQAQDIKELLFDISQMPRMIYEAKPQRVVSFDEILAAVIPDNTSERVRKALGGIGVRTMDYEYGNNVDRLKLINSVDSAAFSLKTNGERRNLVEEFSNVGGKKVRKPQTAREQAFADDIYYGKKVSKEKAKGREAVQKERAKGREKLAAEKARRTSEAARWKQERREMQAAHKDELRSQRAEDRAYYTEKHERQIRELKDRFAARQDAKRESRKAAELRVKIVKHAGQLRDKLMNPTDTKHIPDDLRGVVKNALSYINLESGFDRGDGKRVPRGEGEATKRTLAFMEMRKAFQEIEQSGDASMSVDPDLADNIEMIESMKDVPIASMTSSELETVWRVIKAVETAVSTANKMLGRQKFEMVDEFAQAIKNENAGKRLKKDYRGPIRAMDKLINSGMLVPEAFFHRLGESGKALFKMMRGAQDKNITILDEAVQKTRDLFGKTDVYKIGKQTRKFTFDGETIEVPVADIMQFYLSLKREQYIDHIVIGGVKFGPVNKGVTRVRNTESLRFTPEQISEMIDSLTDEEIRLCDGMQRIVAETAEYGNAATLAVYGYKKFEGKNYWPIKVDRNEVNKDVANEAKAATIAGRGFAKSTRPHANNAVIMGNVFDVFVDHIVDMANYASWLAPMENMARVYNFRFKDEDGGFHGSVKDVIDNVFGENGKTYMEKLMADLNSGVKATNDNPFDTFVRNLKVASVAANIRVFAQQPTAIIRALDSINPMDFVAASFKMRPGTWNKVREYAPIAVWKDWGYFDSNTGRQMKSLFFGEEKKLDAVNNALLAPAGAMDSLAWSHIWNALEVETGRKRKDLEKGSEEFYQAVAERFNEVIDHTQVVDGILQRSDLMRSPDGVTKMATSFKAEPTKIYNMFTTAWYDLRNSQDPKARAKARKTMGKTAFALTLSIAVNAAVQAVVDGLRDDDDDETYVEKVTQAFTGLQGDEETKQDYFKALATGNIGESLNPFTYIAFVSDVVSLLEGYDVKRMDMESISKFIKSATKAVQALSGGGKSTKKEAVINLFAEGSRLFGLPVANIKRDLYSVIRTYANGVGNHKLEYEFAKFVYNQENKNNKKMFLNIAYRAKNDGDDVLYNDITGNMANIFDDLTDKKLEKGLNDFNGVETKPAKYSILGDQKADTVEKFFANTQDIAGDNKQEQIIEQIRAIEDLTNDERSILFHVYYKSDKNNPWA